MTRGRHVLGIFLAAWLAIILQPCAVAGEIEHECPHCPPETMHEGHQGAVLNSIDCVIGGQIGFEARSLQPKSDDLSPQVPVFLAQTLNKIDLSPGSNHQFSNTRSSILPSGPPLNVLNCVYLK